MQRDSAVHELVRVAVVERYQPAELAGGWCTCPTTGHAVRVEECMGCGRAVEFHRGCACESAPFILCDVSEGEDVAEDDESTASLFGP